MPLITVKETQHGRSPAQDTACNLTQYIALTPPLAVFLSAPLCGSHSWTPSAVSQEISSGVNLLIPHRAAR